jgi:16S rRNA (guanine966-N2)-methyltransferase
VREALFSILASMGADESGRVLDLYAGSGALGFEALSRGATEAVMVESARPAALAIRENARSLGLEDVLTLVQQPVERALPRLEGPFDVIFLDPPYADVRASGFGVVLTGAARLLAATGILVLEHSSTDSPAAPAGIILNRSRKYGDTTLSLFVPE